VLLVLLVALGLIAFQGPLIYCPQHYAAATLANLPAGVEELRYQTDQGEQVAFYRRPTQGGMPQRVWLVFVGQGNRALDWWLLGERAGDPTAGYLLFDYPGSGACAGSATPGRIQTSSEQAVETLRIQLGLTPADLAARMAVLGYSLGTGFALQYAAYRPVQRIVLAAPYTSLPDMVDRLFFPPCGLVIWHRVDSRTRLAEIAAQPRPPRTILLHGADDDCIPLAMSAELAAPYPQWVERRVVPGRDHNSIYLDIASLLAGP
jgi:hypothetical protein